MKTRRLPKKNKGQKKHIPAIAQKEFLALYDDRQFNAAGEFAKVLTRKYPKDSFAWKAYSSCLLKTGYPEKAKAAAEKSILLAPNDGHAHHFLARAHHELGSPDAAKKHVLKTIKLAPDFSQGHFSAAEMLAESGDFEKAYEYVSSAEKLGYSDKSCLVLKAHIAVKLGKYSESINIINGLLEKDPDNEYLLNDAANLYKDLGQLDSAEELYLKALKLNPNYHTAYFNYIIGKHYNPKETAENITKTIKNWHQTFKTNEHPFTYETGYFTKNQTIKIGLVSSGFRLHPVGQMITSALENTSGDLEFHGYTTNNSNDFLTKRISKRCRTWNLIGKLKSKQLADKIHSDNIDILIDLSGYGDGSRLPCLALKPAPIIVKWVGGLINTSGHPSIDYLISDNYETPDGVDDQYTEKLIRMPDDYICYTPPTYAPQITALPAISNRHITFGCFNNPSKINSELLQQWAMIMQEMPDSRLFLKSIQYSSEEYTQAIYSAMSELGISPDRIDIEGPSKHRDLLNAYNRVDIALDTWPYSGGLTTCEAFMMGVPVVTLPGPTFAGRHSATHLINAGMPELVVNDWDEYKQRVIELASDITNLSLIRACLRKFLLQSPVCNAEKFGNHFSQAMRAIWSRFLSGKPPAPLNMSSGVANFNEAFKSKMITEGAIHQDEFIMGQISHIPKPAGPLIADADRIPGTPVVSIICATFNHEGYIEDAIKGFLSQKTDFPFEIIIHDDASTDSTAKIIEKYALEFPLTIKPIYQKENQYSRNKKPVDNSLPFAQGKYIAICEGDDYWTDSQKIQKQFDYMERNPDCSLTHHNAFIFNESGIIASSKLPKEFKRSYSSEELINNDCFILTLSVMFRRTFDKFPREREKVVNGDLFLISILGLHGSSKYMDDIKPAAYRVHKKSIWSSMDYKKQKTTLAESYEKLGKFHLKKGRREVHDAYLIKSKNLKS
ncbi:glycosyltransferase [Larsenimonas rhizosphaerae]|uniref:O-linked N-acetylglucosamine transferase family protein n=1 Tax=Larsenimonas rhizosphaerae TaxID=2944682 RepID=UPI0020333073|nr:glycosyltransferase [Larsenimonas rhizosphaerae]MCM2130421.1 glycosyltransferase [Larsenimonas rhizosphaerae]